MSNLFASSARDAERHATPAASLNQRPAVFALILPLVWATTAAFAQDADKPVVRGSYSAAELHEAYRSASAAESQARFRHLAAKEALERVRTAAADAERALERIKAERPTLAEPEIDRSWEELVIGEFEPENAFKKRVSAAKAEAEAEARASRVEGQDALEADTARWRKRVAEAEKRVVAAKAVSASDLAALEKRVQETGRAAWVRPQLPEIQLTVAATGGELPRFDREAMAFREVPVLSEQRLSLPDDDGADGRLKDAHLFYRDTLRVDLRCESLAVAKRFKEDVLAGRVAYAIVGDLIVEEEESPVIVQERVVTNQSRVEQEESAVGGVLGALAGAALVVASGGDGTSMNDQIVVENMRKLGAGERKETTEQVELQPEVAVPGTRLKLAFRPTRVVALTTVAGDGRSHRRRERRPPIVRRGGDRGSGDGSGVDPGEGRSGGPGDGDRRPVRAHRGGLGRGSSRHAGGEALHGLTPSRAGGAVVPGRCDRRSAHGTERGVPAIGGVGGRKRKRPLAPARRRRALTGRRPRSTTRRRCGTRRFRGSYGHLPSGGFGRCRRRGSGSKGI